MTTARILATDTTVGEVDFEQRGCYYVPVNITSEGQEWRFALPYDVAKKLVEGARAATISISGRV